MAAVCRRQAPRWTRAVVVAAARYAVTVVAAQAAAMPVTAISGAGEIRICHRDLGSNLDDRIERPWVSKHALRRRIKDLGLA